MLAVDRDRRHRAEVGAPADVGWFDRGTKTPRFLDGFVSVRVRDVVFANDDLCVNAWLVDLAEHLDDPTNRTAGRRRPTGDLNNNHVVWFGSPALSGRHVNVRGYPAVKRDHVREICRVRFETADDGVVRALDDADNAPFEAAWRLTLDANEHTIAVHRFREIRGGDGNVPSFARLRV